MFKILVEEKLAGNISKSKREYYPELVGGCRSHKIHCVYKKTGPNNMGKVVKKWQDLKPGQVKNLNQNVQEEINSSRHLQTLTKANSRC